MTAFDLDLPAGGAPGDGDDHVVLRELHELSTRLRDLDGGPLRDLEDGVRALSEGDFARPLHAEPVHVGADFTTAEIRALADVLNSMVTRLTMMMEAYETLRRDLARALGDRSCLPDLYEALKSLNAHCLTDLDTGLQAITDGKLTYSAAPVTHPLRAEPGNALGQVGELFNEMLARSRTALRSYEAMREDLRASLGDRSCLDDLRIGLQSLQRHCLRDLEEALEALSEGTALTRRIAPATKPIAVADETFEGELAALFNRALRRAQSAVLSLAEIRELPGVR